MSWYVNLLSSVAVLAGGGLLSLAARRTSHLIEKLEDEKEKASWRQLRSLMLFFLLGYLTAIVFVFLGKLEFLVWLVAVVFFFGGLFVLKTVEAGDRSIEVLDQTLKTRTEALEESRQKAESAVVARTRFMANVSHEIRTPMNAVIGLTTLLLQSELDEQQREDVLALQQSGEVLLRVVTDVLDFAKFESDSFALEPVAINLDEVLDATVGIWLPGASAKGLNLSIERSDDWWSYWRGDGARIQQILYNLVANAIRFTDEGEIVLVASCKPNRVMIEVRDTGCGMTEEEQEQIFHSFRQASTDRGGTGLGLTIAHRLCQVMGGNLTVESSPGKGSRFFVTLELSRTDPTEAEEESMISSLNLALRVLVVDDNEVNLKVARRYLERLGCNVYAAENGQEAVDLANQNSFNLILMDCQMPVMTGVEATEKIRQEGKNKKTPIYALTAVATPDELQSCLDRGMNGYMTKPVQLPKLKKLLSELGETLSL